MDLRPHRWQFSHPNIPICPKRLATVIAEGDAAEEAMSGRQLRTAGLVSGDTSRDKINARRTKLLAKQDHLRSQARNRDVGESLAKVKADLAEVSEALKAFDSAENGSRKALIAIVERRRRCAAYAVECGDRSPELVPYVEVERAIR